MRFSRFLRELKVRFMQINFTVKYFKRISIMQIINTRFNSDIYTEQAANNSMEIIQREQGSLSFSSLFDSF